MDNTTLAGTARAARTPASFITRFRRLAIWLVLLMLGCGLHLSLHHGYPSISLSPARADNIQYIYDELGRLVQATDVTSGQAIIYTYDAVGNITSQTAVALSSVSIGYFSPGSGPVGSQVTIDGTGFSATPAADVVQFNGAAATIVSATQTQLVVTVPTTATNGPITVQVGTTTATSSASFTVGAALEAGPTISSLSPTTGTPGQVVTITGTNFQTVPADNRVTFDDTPAVVSGGTTTVISTSVPANSGSGKVQVVTPYGIATSPMDFIVVPTGYSATNIGSTGRMPTDGSTTNISLPTASHISVQLFDGNEGDLLTIGATSTTLASCTLKVFNPAGALLTSGTVTASGQGVQLPALPLTGTYTIVVDPGSNTGSIALDIVRPLVGTLTLNGTPTPVMLSPPGRRALLTFSGTQGIYANLSVSGVTVSAGTISLLAPNGGVVDSRAFTTTGTNLQPLLPATGTYTVLINPTGSVGGSLSVALTTSNSPTLTVGQSTGVNLTGTTPVSVTFEATQGQYLALAASTTQSTITQYSVTVSAPDGTQVVTGTLNTAFGSSGYTGSTMLNLGPLALGGTYTVVVQGANSGSGMVTLTPSTPISGTLATDGTTSSVSISTAGQGLIYTSPATAGQYVALVVNEDVNNLGRINAAAVTVLRPDGSTLATGTLATTFLTCSGGGTCLGTSGYYGSVIVNVGPVPETGNYTFLIQQTGTGSLDTGVLNVTLSTPLTGALVTNASSTNPSLSTPGQGLLYTFTGTTGQYLGLGFGEGSAQINGGAVTVFNPDGSPLSTGNFTSTSLGSGLYSGSAILNLGPLTQSGTYTVLFQQTGAGSEDTGGLSITLSTPVTGTLAVGSSANEPMSLAGQPVQLTFVGTAGQYASLGIQEGGGIPGATVTILKPDGTVLTSGPFVATPCNGFGCGGYTGTGVVNMGPLPSSGTYSVLVQQTAVGAGSLTLTLSNPATGSLSANTTANAGASLLGQSMELSFSGSPGQYLALGVQETTDGIPGALITVLKPDGTPLATGTPLTTTACTGLGCPGTYSGTALVNIGPLPVSGTYNVLAQQTGGGTGTLSLALSSPASGGALGNGTATNATATLLGQGVQVTFAGTAGSSVSLLTSESSSGISGATLSVFNPDGTPLATGTLSPSVCSGCTNLYTGSTSMNPPLLPQTGTYTVMAQQKSAATGTLSFTATGVQAPSPSSSSYSTSTAGQSTTFTFSATAGQSVSLVISNLTLTPASPNYASYYITAPNGAFYTNGSCTAGPAGCEFAFYDLPQTGAYSVKITPASSSQTLSFSTTFSPDVASTLSLGTSNVINLTTTGQGAVSAFTATAGETLALQIGGISATPANTTVTVIVYNSAGSQVTSTTTQTGATLNLTNLAAGTYNVFVTPQTPATGTFQLTLQPGVIGAVPATATSTSFTTVEPGQNAYLTFSATAGQSIAMVFQNVVLTPNTNNFINYYITAPNGAFYTNGSCSPSVSGCELAFYNVPQTGTYNITMSPGSVAETMSFSVLISVDTSGTLAYATPTVVSFGTPGAGETLTFTTTSPGQDVALYLSGVTTTPANAAVTVYVYNSSGGQVTNGSTQTSTTLNLTALPVGTYTVFITPQTPVTGTLQVTLQQGVIGILPLDGTTSSFSTAVPGQNAYLSFNATAGQNVSLVLKGITLIPATNNFISYYITAPNGAFYTNGSCAPSANGCELAFFNMPQTGAYSVTVSPGSGTETMSFSTLLSVGSAGVLSVGTASVVSLTTPGQSQMLNFVTTMPGQDLALNVSGVSTTPGGATISMIVYNSSGGQVTSTSTATGATLNLTNLPVDTYRVFIAPQTPVTATLQVILQPGTVGSVPSTGTATSFSTLEPGQNAYLTFSATTGQSMSLVFQNIVLTPSTNNFINYYITAPNGAFYTNGSCSPSTAGCELAFYNMPQTGTYNVTMSPGSTLETMSFSLLISVDPVAALSVGTPATVTVGTLGQGEVLTFTTTTAGQDMALNVGGITSTPANTTYTVIVYNSSNGQVTSTSTATGATLNLTNLAVGTYSVFIAPQTPATGTLQVTLQPGTVGSVPSTGTATSFSTLEPGQNAYLTFSATAGQSMSLVFQNIVLTPSTNNFINYYITAPNGAFYTNGSCSPSTAGCELAFYNMPQTGTYNVTMSPGSTLETMSFSLLISVDPVAALSVGTPATVTVGTLGQGEVLTFTTTTAGQDMALNVGGITSTPANTTYTVIVYNSSNGQVTSTSTATGATLNLTNLAVGTYSVFIAPQTPATGTLQVTLQPGTVGSVPSTGTATSFSTLEPGQNAYLTFSATAGQSMSLVFQNIVLTPSTNNSISYYITAPNGAYYTNGSCSPSAAGCELAFYNMPQTGTYNVTMSPGSTSETMSFSAIISPDVTGSLIKGTPSSLSLSEVGQSAVPTFVATASENVALTVSNLTSTPANTTYTIRVYNSSGSQVSSGSTSSGTTLNLTSLAAGTYTVLIAPSTPATATLQVGYQ